MNAAYLHIIVNHVSLFALVFGTIALIASMKPQQDFALLVTGLLAGVSATRDAI